MKHNAKRGKCIECGELDKLNKDKLCQLCVEQLTVDQEQRDSEFNDSLEAEFFDYEENE